MAEQEATNQRIAQIVNLVTYLCYARKPGSAFRGTLMLEFPQSSGPQVTMTVRVTDEYVCAFEGPPPDGKVTCRACIGVEDFIHIYSGKASASEVGQMVFGGRIRVPGWKFRELASFGTSFDFSYESWDNYYRLKPHADFGISKSIAPNAFACSHAFVAASKLIDGSAQPSGMTVPDKIIAMLLEPGAVSEQLTFEVVTYFGDVREKVLAVCDETVDDVAAVAHQVYWDISRFKLLPKRCEDLIPPFVGLDVTANVSPFHKHIAQAVDQVLAIRKKASDEIDQLKISAKAEKFVDEWVQKAQLIWDEDIQPHKIVPFLADVQQLARVKVASGLRTHVATMEAAQQTDFLTFLSLPSRSDIETAHRALRPVLAYFTSTPSSWIQRAVADDQTQPVLPCIHCFTVVNSTHRLRGILASLGWFLERAPLRAENDFSDWWDARPRL